MTAGLKHVGHKGADLIEPGNTTASFDAALAHGVHMIELDVLPERGGDRLMLAHDYEDAAERHTLSMEEGFAYLASEPFAAVELIVDLKLPGYERRVVEALADAGLTKRVLVSTTYRESLRTLRAADPAVRLGWSVPRARRDYTKSKLMLLPALGALHAIRIVLPRRAAQAIRNGTCEAIMAHWRLITPRLVAAVKGAGGELYAWTVDDATRIQALAAMGVTGVITNDPRLFESQA